MSLIHQWTPSALVLGAFATTDAQSQSIGDVRLRRYATDIVVAEGRLVGRSGSSLVLESAGGRATYAISPDHVTERFSKKGHAVRGALVGLVVGTTILVAGTEVENSVPPGQLLCIFNCDTETTTSGLATAAFILAPVIGAFIGSRTKTGRGWSGFDANHLHDGGPALSLELAPGKVGLAIKLGW